MRQHASALPGEVHLPERSSVRWPGDARLAVVITIDLYGSEAANTLQIIGSSLDFGVRRGAWNVLDALDRMSIRATFNVPAVTAQRYPALIKEIVTRGHDLAAMGRRNESMWHLGREETAEEIESAVQYLAEIANKPIHGWRTPHLRPSAHTLGALPSLGIKWDSTLRNDDTPYALVFDDGPLIEIPVRAPNDDSRYFGLPGPTMSTPEAFEVWQDEADWLRAEAASVPTMFSTTFHPFYIGRPGQLAAFEKLFAALTNDEATWFATCAEVAEWWTTNQNWS